MEIEVQENAVTDYGKITTYGGGALLGHQGLALHKHLSLDFFIGPNLAVHNFQTQRLGSKHYNTYRMFNKASVRSGFTVGFAF